METMVVIQLLITLIKIAFNKKLVGRSVYEVSRCIIILLLRNIW